MQKTDQSAPPVSSLSNIHLARKDFTSSVHSWQIVQDCREAQEAECIYLFFLKCLILAQKRKKNIYLYLYLKRAPAWSLNSGKNPCCLLLIKAGRCTAPDAGGRSRNEGKEISVSKREP